jgi:hypothetical protein
LSFPHTIFIVLFSISKYADPLVHDAKKNSSLQKPSFNSLCQKQEI